MINDSSNHRISVLLADDHTLFRAGIREMLSAGVDLQVIGEVATGLKAISTAVEKRPDVLLLDVEMPGPGAAEVIRQIRDRASATRIIVVTMHDDPDIVQELLSCGAAAYLVKTVMRDELLAAVRSVVESASTVMLSVSRQTFELFRERAKTDRGAVLTERELAVLRLTAQALSNVQIAARLTISEATVKRHLTNIFAKLGAVSRMDAVRKATSAHLLPDDPWT
jgi:DNA-binding NarL/FixJ family response regulator